MDKAVLKKFAIESRQDLMQRMKNKIKTFYIDEEFSKHQSGDVYILANNKHSLNLSKEEYDKRELLIKRINELGLDQVIEEAAYTWFNRIVAIRYMEIHDYLPLTRENQSLGIRVLSSKDNTPDPEIMKFTNLVNPELDIDFKKEKYVELKDDNEKFKYILLLVCRKLGRVIPQVFDGVTDYIDILIPDNLLNESGFVNKIITEVAEENYEQVEIIGWLYQYYNQTEKDRVISSKKTYKKNEIPYATQLFTPDWIVKYMVENTLGRFWIEHNGDKNLIKKWKYYIPLNENKKIDSLDPINIKCIDPCSGSGHVLVYMFEVLFEIYLSYGYSYKDIPKLIIKNNLYGLDIDDRAGQLSVLSIILKAMEFDRTILNKINPQDINILSITESNSIPKSSLTLFKENAENVNDIISHVYDMFINAKEIGSLLYIDENVCDLKKILDTITNFSEHEFTLFDYEKIANIKFKFKPIIKTAINLSQKYDVIVTNPPYLSNSVMPNNLKQYVNRRYVESKNDLYTCFIRNVNNQLKENGYSALVTMQSWMFLSSFADFRKYIIENYNIKTLMHMENNVMRIAFGTVATIFEKRKCEKNCDGAYFRIKYADINENDRPKEFPVKSNGFYLKNIDDFKKIPGYNIAYWVSQEMILNFEKGKPFSDYADLFQGIITGNNEIFLRYWHELNINKVALNKKTMNDINIKEQYWIPYNKGGNFRKWYGNQDYVINWKNGPKDKTRGKSSFSEYYLREYVSWSYITSSTLASRYFPYGFLWDVAGSGFFDKTNNIKYLHALLGSIIGIEILKIINPTVNYQVENIAVLPVLEPKEKAEKKIIEDLVNECIQYSKLDWDDYEVSWNFNKLPFIDDEKNIESGIDKYIKICKFRYEMCMKNEERINKFFIDLYNSPEYDYKVSDTTIRIPNKKELLKYLISYAVGCMFGRYSLDEEGLIYAGGEFDKNRYKKFKVDLDNIIPITDEAYFDDDIVQRFRKFIEVSFGKETLNENLDFIADTLGKKGTETSEETIRRYFLNDFFNDHCKIYQKRPIYWLLDSGKKNGFKALIYMHRYDENLIPKLRINYLHRVQTTYEKLLSDVNYKLTTDLSMVDKKDAQKRQADLNAKLQEIKEYDEKIAHIANQRISIDLDDGVKVNYEKFKDILAKIK